MQIDNAKFSAHPERHKGYSLHHHQVEIEIGDEKVDVDRSIAPLVEALCELPEFYTLSSCECDDSDGQAYVIFEAEEGYRPTDLLALFEALQNGVLTDAAFAHFSMHYGLPRGMRCSPRIYYKPNGLRTDHDGFPLPCCELSCNPQLIQPLSQDISRFAKWRFANRDAITADARAKRAAAKC
jgi:hypothetical protein